MAAESTVELGDVKEGLAAISRAATQRKVEALNEIKPLAKADLRARGRTRTGPDGSPWPAGAASSKRKARRDRRRNRRPGNLGKLTSAWKSKLEPEQLRFVNAIDYALLHHTGGRIGRGAVLPARPFAGFSAEFADKAVEIWSQTINGAW